MILSRYIARRFGWTILRILLVFAGILMLIDVIDQLRRFAGRGLSFAEALRLAALNMPASLYQILPLMMILAAIALFLGLARSSELVVVRAAGRSGLRFLLTPAIVAMTFGAFAVAVLNPLVAATQRQYADLRAFYTQGTASTLSISDEGLWLRQGGEGGQTVIHADRASGDATVLFGASFLTLDAAGAPRSRIEADEARLVPGEWRLTGAKLWNLAVPNPETASVQRATLGLPSDLTRDAIRDSFGAPDAIPVWDLPAYIAGLEEAGFSARRHRVWLQMELALPLMLGAMVLLAAGFTMRHARAGGAGRMVLLALLGGFAVFFFRNFAQVLGDNGQIPVALAAWTPPVAATLFAVGLILHREEG